MARRSDRQGARTKDAVSVRPHPVLTDLNTSTTPWGTIDTKRGFTNVYHLNRDYLLQLRLNRIPGY